MDKCFKTSCTQHESTCAPNPHFVYGPEVAVNQDSLPSRGWKSCRLSRVVQVPVWERTAALRLNSRTSSRGPTWLLSDWTRPRPVTTEGRCRADVWSELWRHKRIKHKPSDQMFVSRLTSLTSLERAESTWGWDAVRADGTHPRYTLHSITGCCVFVLKNFSQCTSGTWKQRITAFCQMNVFPKYLQPISHHVLQQSI